MTDGPYDWMQEPVMACGCGHHPYEACECPEDCWDYGPES